MKDPVYKLIELTGASTDSIEDAVDREIEPSVGLVTFAFNHNLTST